MSPDTEIGMGQGNPPVRECIDAGIKPTLSCDITSMVGGDLLTQARFALEFVRGRDNDPIMDRGTVPTKLSLSSRDALTWATVNGADACRLGNKVGSLTPGKKADIILIGGETFNMFPRPNPVGTALFQAHPGNIHSVLIDGKFRKRDGRLVGVDYAKAREMATKQSESLFARAEQSGPSLPEVSTAFMESFEPSWQANLAEANLAG